MFVFRPIIRYIFAFLFGLIGTIVMLNFQTSIGIIVAVNFVFVFLLLYLPALYIILWDTNIERIERYLILQKKNPVYNLIYAVANGIDEEVEKSINSLLKKHKQRHKQALYKVIYALYKKEIVSAKQEIEFIQPPAYQYYYKSFIYMEERNFTEANQLIEKISIPWMKSALLSEMEIKLDNPEKAFQLAKQAFHEAKGQQKYILYKTYQRMFPEMEISG